ncbi:MAG: hypothetical protein N2448_08110 [Caloramator sp.]|nr:hypothetical protein [Caloramator sp.]
MNNIILIEIINFYSLVFSILNLISIFLGSIKSNSLLFIYITAFTFILYKSKNKNKQLLFFLLFPAFLPYLFFSSINYIFFISTINFCSYYFVLKIVDNINYSNASEHFTKTLYLLSAIIFIGLLSGKIHALNLVCAPYIFLSLISSITLLRTLRNIELNAMNKKINRINLIYSMIISLSSIILSLDYLRKGFYSILLKTYFILTELFMYVFYWVLLFIGYILSFLIIILRKLLSRLSVNNVKIQMPVTPIENIKTKDYKSISNFINSNLVLNFLFKGLFFLLIIYIIIKIFKRYNIKNKELEIYTEKKEYIKIEKNNPLGKIKSTVLFKKTKDYSDQIRFYYLKFIKKSIKNKIEIKNSDTTFEINQKSSKIFDTEILNSIRDIYINVRYGSFKPDKKTVKIFIENYKKLNIVKK